MQAFVAASQPRGLNRFCHRGCSQHRQPTVRGTVLVRSSDLKEKSDQDAQIKSTLSDLDALLGIEEEEKKKEEEKKEGDKPQEGQDSPLAQGNMSQGSFVKILQADLEKARQSGDPDAFKKKVDEMSRVVEEAKKMAESDNPAQLGQEVDKLIKVLETQGTYEFGIEKEDLSRIKKEVFGPLSFWLTESRPVDPSQRELVNLMQGGVLIRGNLRGDNTEVYGEISRKIEDLFPGKYEVIMVEDPQFQDEAGNVSSPQEVNPDQKPKTKVAFQIIPSDSDAVTFYTGETTTLGWVVCIILSVLTFGACFSVGIAATVLAKLPNETLEWLANSDNLASGLSPPGISGDFGLDQVAGQAAPVALSLLGFQLAHEIGHRAAALTRGVKLGIPYLLPNNLVGTVGGVTTFKSLLKSNKDMWDITAAGPVTGITVSGLVFLYGLFATSGAVSDGLEQIPIPTGLLQGSLGLGSIVRNVLGSDLLKQGSVAASPLLLAGWCGLTANALNLLPVGAIDGGRLMQATYGKNILALSSFFVYVGLGVGFIGGSLSFPFGLFVLFVQRMAEKCVKDNVTEVDSTRKNLTNLLIFLSVMILLPMAPDVSDSAGVGGPSQFL